MAREGEWTPDWSKASPAWVFFGGLGLGALVTGGVMFFAALATAALLIGPFLFWLAWNVLDLGVAIGLGELGFWAIVLATVFLVVDWFGKTVIAGIVMLLNPDWFQTEATLRWPEPSFKHFVAVAILAALASFPHAKHRHGSG
ncbi:MAG: hypothetical protein HKN94_03340 [Acidimicrobiales bacterium]|nr:hypothetical protein [Acidimicrobiales bacterium]RZV46077.1 MAG: hypothetical protein EX269_08220 [Acidimicrobiales bacterium]